MMTAWWDIGPQVASGFIVGFCLRWALDERAARKDVEALERRVEALEVPAAEPTPDPSAELRQMMRDPRYWQQRDPAFVAKVAQGFRNLYPGSRP